MAATRPWANRILAAVLMIAVAIVGFFALSRLFNAEQGDQAISEIEGDVAGAERAYPGREIKIEDRDYPLTVSCVRASGSEPVFVVIVNNEAASATDYLVAVELSNDSGESTTALAEIDDIRSDEERETVLVPDADIGNIDTCTITAVQGERRVLLSR